MRDLGQTRRILRVKGLHARTERAGLSEILGQESSDLVRQQADKGQT